MIIFLAILTTMVIYEETPATWGIEIYDYSEEPIIEVICPEDVYDCLEPREKKETISLDDIKNCAENGDYEFI